MKRLYIDLETYSGTDIGAGVHRYVADPDFKILLLAYAWDEGPVEVVDIASGDPLPREVRNALTSATVEKVAHNAAFERTCLTQYLKLGRGGLYPGQWRDTMVECYRAGLPGSLEDAGEALGIKAAKLRSGAALIRLFCSPDKKGKRVLPSVAPEKWGKFKKYCMRDVEAEREISRRLDYWPACEFDERLRVMDDEINDRGVMLDLPFAASAAAMARETAGEAEGRLRQLTGLDNPNSDAQLKSWIEEKTGKPCKSLMKEAVADMLAAPGLPEDVREALTLRSERAKSSLAKYDKALECVCPDRRIRGLLQFHGTRTGRWAGRLVQMQNLPQNHMKDLGRARELVRAGDLAGLKAAFPGRNPRDILSELIRTMFVACRGYTLQVCDFSAIEARVLAWFCGEEWVLDVFREGGDIYCATASKMFGVTVEKHGQNSELRAKGKVAALALGYGGGPGALSAMGADRMGMGEKEKRDTVTQWREANPHIVRAWLELERAAINSIKDPGTTYFHGNKLSLLTVPDPNDPDSLTLGIKLPSGRWLRYPGARIGIEGGAGRFDGDGRECMVYDSVNQKTRKFEETRTYGGKLWENIVQATARDILGVVLLRCRKCDIRPVFHVHDEIVAEVPAGSPLERFTRLFDEPVEWAPRLPLKGAGYETPYYIKD